MTAERILAIARAEIGTKESPPNSNKCKYNTAYYGREVSGSGYAWCAAFVWWCFREAGAPELFYGGQKTAYCPTLMTYHKGQGQAVQGGYKPGDVIFFNFSGKQNAAHVGICESWDGQYITTIDGNTGTGNEANGGAVMRRKRHKKYIVGAYRPKYQAQKKEEPELTESEVRKLVRDEYAKIEAERAALPASDWAKPYIQAAIDAGAFSKNASGSIDRPKAHITREEMAVVAAKLSK